MSGGPRRNCRRCSRCRKNSYAEASREYSASDSRFLSRSRDSASMVPPWRTHGSRPPCRRCRHCTRNSMSRIPPRVSLMSRPGVPRAAVQLSLEFARASRTPPPPREKSSVIGISVAPRIKQFLPGRGLARGNARLDQHLQFPVARRGFVVSTAPSSERQTSPSRPSGRSRRSTRYTGPSAV